MTPTEWDYIPEREFLQEKFKAHDINIKLLTEEEVAKKRADRENSKMNQLAIQLQESEIAKNNAQAMTNLTKAKEKNIEATRRAQEPLEEGTVNDPRLTEAELAKMETERGGKERDIQRQDEVHVLEMEQKMDSHETKKDMDMTKAAHEIAIKQKVAEEGIKDKAQLAKASAEAKIIAAKKKPAAKPARKPVKKAK
jgi:hypothetical protein